MDFFWDMKEKIIVAKAFCYSQNYVLFGYELCVSNGRNCTAWLR